jgi:hypothetical protein
VTGGRRLRAKVVRGATKEAKPASKLLPPVADFGRRAAVSFEIERTGVQAARALNKHATQHLDRVGGGGRKLAAIPAWHWRATPEPESR